MRKYETNVERMWSLDKARRKAREAEVTSLRRVSAAVAAENDLPGSLVISGAVGTYAEDINGEYILLRNDGNDVH